MSSKSSKSSKGSKLFIIFLALILLFLIWAAIRFHSESYECDDEYLLRACKPNPVSNCLSVCTGGSGEFSKINPPLSYNKCSDACNRASNNQCNTLCNADGECKCPTAAPSNKAKCSTLRAKHPDQMTSVDKKKYCEWISACTDSAVCGGTPAPEDGTFDQTVCSYVKDFCNSEFSPEDRTRCLNMMNESCV